MILDELQRDALAEVVNIGVGRAAATLAKMAGEEVILTVPAISAVSPEQAASLLGGDEAGELLCVCETFRGALSGQAQVVFTQASAQALLAAVAAPPADQGDADAAADEALTEIGNVLLQAWLSTMANELRQTLSIGVPHLLRSRAGAMFDNAVDLILFVYVNFHLEGRRVRGYIILSTDLPSRNMLTAMLDDLIQRVANSA